jgi:hypothetical protein
MTQDQLVWLSIGLSIFLFLLIIWLFIRMKNIDKARREFFLEEQPKKVDEVIVEHNQNIKLLKNQLDELGEYVRNLAMANKKNFQKIGFVRFNPFGDAGGSISFVVALLDADQNGFVLSSLHGREGDRVYSKEIKKGKAKTPLTQEEMEAIKQAV